MSNIQIPSSIKKISSSVAAHVHAHYPDCMSLEDVPVDIQNKWESTCDHEMFYQDVNRFMGDIYQQKCLSTPSGW